MNTLYHILRKWLWQDRGEWGPNSTLDVERYSVIGSVTSAEYRECKTLNVLTPEIAVEKVTDNKD